MKIVTLFALFVLISIQVNSQVDIQTIASDFKAPTGIEKDQKGNFWVADSGSGNNDGKIWLLKPSGKKELVIEGLPSSIDKNTKEVKGTLRAQILGNQYLAVLTGKGSSEQSGQVLLFDLRKVENRPSPLKATEFNVIINVKEFANSLGYEESNPYSTVVKNNTLYIVDASANAIFTYNLSSQAFKQFAKFPKLQPQIIQNTEAVEAVPTRIISNPNGGFYVSTFSGFPHPEIAAVIFTVSDKGGVRILHRCLTMATDIMLAPNEDGLLILEFGQFYPNEFMPVPNSAKILHINKDGDRSLLASGFGPSMGMYSEDGQTFYVTNLFEGTVAKITTEAIKTE